MKINIYIKIFVGIVLSITFIMIGLVSKNYLLNFDFYGPNLTVRETLIASAGPTRNFIFEISEGKYDVQLHRYQYGKLVSVDSLNLIQRTDEDRMLPEGIAIGERATLLISVTRGHDETLTWDIALNGRNGRLNLFDDISTSIREQSGARTGRGNLGEQPLALMYHSLISVNELNQSVSVSHFLDDLIFGHAFVIDEYISELTEISDIFIVSIRKL